MKIGEYVVICDLAENYTFVTQEEVQSSHWNKQQVTIFPMAVYYEEGEILKPFSFAVISEELKHLSTDVYHFQCKLVQFIKNNSQLKKVKIIYFSDGCAAQFKNKKNFINLCNHLNDFNIAAEWNFFATAHGKGPADGIGGTIKRMARIESLRTFDRAQFQTAEELFNWAKENIKGINFAYSSKQEQKHTAHTLLSKSNSLRVCPGTQSVHQFIPSDENRTILCKPFSSYRENYFKHTF